VTAVSAMRIVSVVHVIHLLRFISSSIAMTVGCGLYVRSMVCAAIDPVRKQDSCAGRATVFVTFGSVARGISVRLHAAKRGDVPATAAAPYRCWQGSHSLSRGPRVSVSRHRSAHLTSLPPAWLSPLDDHLASKLHTSRSTPRCVTSRICVDAHLHTSPKLARMN
jgi:hypothetical protein